MDLKSFTQAIQQIADEKGISREKIAETIEMALAAAYKRDYGKRGQIVRAVLDPVSGKVSVKQIKIAVDETMIKSEEEIAKEEEERAARGTNEEERKPSFVRAVDGREEDVSSEALAAGEKKVRFNPERHLMLEEARKIKSDINPGDELEFPLEYHEEYGRIAAQTAKQVIIQRIREAEREAVFEEFKNKEGELVSGIVQRIDGRNVFIDIGRTAGVLPPEEQIPYERYKLGERLKALIIVVEKNPKGPGIFLSRSHPRLLIKLFEIEVPEIAAGIVKVKSIAREAGSRAKVAVASLEEGVDPVGSLVGQKGIRVSTVIQELGGEKIDIIEWDENPARFVANSLSPARVLHVEIEERRKEAKATVPDDQLSLAIGKGGQNVRLAAKLTGWKIDVRSDRRKEEVPSEEKDAVSEEKDRAETEPLSEKEEDDSKKEEKSSSAENSADPNASADNSENKPKKKSKKS